MSNRFRLPTDDFYCFRFAVWYDTLDCAVRTHFRTAPGCRDCAQGRENARLRRPDLARVKLNRDAIGFADLAGVDGANGPGETREAGPGIASGAPFARRSPRLVHSR